MGPGPVNGRHRTRMKIRPGERSEKRTEGIVRAGFRRFEKPFHPVFAGLRRFRPFASRGFGVGGDPPGEAGLRDLARGQAQNDLDFVLLRRPETIPVEGQERL